MFRRHRKLPNPPAPVGDEEVYQAERERRAYERIAKSMQEKLHPSPQQAYVDSEYDILGW